MIYKIYVVVYIVLIIAVVASCIATTMRAKKLHELTCSVIDMSEMVVEQNRILRQALGLYEREEGEQE